MSYNFHLKEILHVPDGHWRDAEFAASAVKQYRFIHGHLHFEFVKDHIDTAAVVTFLRDPVERVLSLYFFLRKQDLETQTDPVARFQIEQAQALSIKAFVEHTDPVIAAMVADYQLMVLLSASQAAAPSDTWVASALKNLGKYQFVGIADSDLMSDASLTMNRIFGWSTTRDTPRVNATRRSSTDGELQLAREAIATRNRFDTALYDEVRTRFLAKLAVESKTRDHHQTALKAQRKRYRTGLTSPVTMDQPLRCWGWHDRETEANGEEWWRCAAQLRAGLELRVPPDTELILLFELRDVHPRVSVEETVVEAQERALPSNLFFANNRWIIAATVDPSNIDPDGLLSLQIVCKEKEAQESFAPKIADSRDVTIALDRINVLSEKSAGSFTFAILRQSIEKQAAGKSHLAALLDRAERSEVYCASLISERAALTDRAEHAEAHFAALSSELKKLQEQYGALSVAREKERIDTEQNHAALTDRAERAETYCGSLSSELKKVQEQYRALSIAREKERIDTEQNHAALIDRAERAEAYCGSLSSELKKQQEQYQALSNVLERERINTEQSHAALIDRAEQAQKELQEQRDAPEALRRPGSVERTQIEALLDQAAEA